MNRIEQSLMKHNSNGTDPKKLLSIYFTAGYPNLTDTAEVIKQLQSSGVDMIEIGLPFSDPLADGPTIQASSTAALDNGMTTDTLFEQLKSIRDEVSIPLLIMGYFNPMLQYGIEAFCKKCSETGTTEESIAVAEKIGFKTDLVAINPLNEDVKVPVYFANFVLMDYGLGAVFGCPAHDQRDLDFARKYNLKVEAVVTPNKEDLNFTVQNEAYTV